MLIGCHRVCGVTWHPSDRQSGRGADHLMCLGPPDQEQQTEGGTKMSPLLVCLEGSKAEDEFGAMLLCRSNAKKPNIRHTNMEGPSGHRMELRMHMQRQCRRKAG